MPTNRHAIIRYRIIDHCLQQRHRKWTAVDLAEACAEALAEIEDNPAPPSRATITRDLRLLRTARPVGYDAPIVWDARKRSYYYADPEYSIFRGPLREDDVQALQGALSILQQFRYFSRAEELEGLIGKLQEELRPSRRTESAVLQLSQPINSPAYRWLDFLYQSAEQAHCLQLTYQPFQRPAYRAVVSPYLIKEYNGRWFLIAYHHARESTYTFAVDRITKVERYLLTTFYRMPQFDPDTYFRHIIGVTVLEGQSLQHIRFRTTPLRARYLLTKPVHTSLEVVRETEEYVDFSLHLIPNYELESWLLAFGEEVRVLQPLWLANKLRQRLQRAVDWYEQAE